MIASKSAERVEQDTMGEIRVPAGRLWGAQTQRSLHHFAISSEQLPRELISALALTKRCAAEVNAELGELPTEIARAIAQAADEVLAGQHTSEFPLVVWQTGSGTQSNMNMNEVLANRASELLGGGRGSARRVHPNDHVNRGQSSNDVFPTAMLVAGTEAMTRRVLPSLRALRDAFEAKRREFSDVVKLGRTHLMDATPLTVGQEIGGWVSQLDHGLAHLADSLPHLSELPIGGTAVGTGLNAHRELASRATARLSELSGLGFRPSPSKFEAISAHDAFVFAHGALKTVAASLTKIANDLRWLASGPRGGLSEMRLPANEPGSSIMPGKTNPTQAEALLMVCAQIMGNDVTLNIAGASGNFQLNVYKPLIAHCFLMSCRLLADGCESFRSYCVAGLELEPERIRHHLEQSLMLVTSLTPHIGYDRAAQIAKHAHHRGISLRQAALELKLASEEDFERWVRPDAMTRPSGG